MAIKPLTTAELRKREDKEDEKLKHPTEAHSVEISHMIDKCLKDKHKVWCLSDEHFYIKDKKDHTKTYKRPGFESQIKQWTDNIKPDDVVIYLGDLVDGEHKNQDDIQNIVLGLPGHKILVRGNNDLFDDSFYKKCGFKFVVRSFIWNKIIFTHIPVENNLFLNIHGHLHFDYKTNKIRKCEYWIPYTNQVCVFNNERRPQELQDIIKQRKEYRDHIFVNWEKVEEAHKPKNIFEQVMDLDELQMIVDPYDD